VLKVLRLAVNNETKASRFVKKKTGLRSYERRNLESRMLWSEIRHYIKRHLERSQ
jgi:hypothetical protein